MRWGSLNFQQVLKSFLGSREKLFNKIRKNKKNKKIKIKKKL